MNLAIGKVSERGFAPCEAFVPAWDDIARQALERMRNYGNETKW